jgi:hypothetical protein
LRVDLITGGLTLNGSGVGGAGALQGAGTASHRAPSRWPRRAPSARRRCRTLTLKNQVSGTGPLTKVGDGVVELSGATLHRRHDDRGGTLRLLAGRPCGP